MSPCSPFFEICANWEKLLLLLLFTPAIKARIWGIVTDLISELKFRISKLQRKTLLTFTVCSMYCIVQSTKNTQSTSTSKL